MRRFGVWVTAGLLIGCHLSGGIGGGAGRQPDGSRSHDRASSTRGDGRSSVLAVADVRVAERLPVSMVPSRVEVRPATPRLPGGKPDRAGLAATARGDMALAPGQGIPAATAR